MKDDRISNGQFEKKTMCEMRRQVCQNNHPNSETNINQTDVIQAVPNINKQIL